MFSRGYKPCSRLPCSPKYAERSHVALLLCRGRLRNMYKDFYARAQLLFPSLNSLFGGVLVLVLVAAAFVSLMPNGRDLLALMLLTHSIGNWKYLAGCESGEKLTRHSQVLFSRIHCKVLADGLNSSKKILRWLVILKRKFRKCLEMEIKEIN